MSRKPGRVMRLRIALADIKPEIWRLIEVPESYSFWDLHVAIQDAMGWLDYHLHAFAPPDLSGGRANPIGIPDDMMDGDTIAGWEVPLTQYFVNPGDTLGYEYDFGDGWYHSVELVSRAPREPKQKYPRCIDGARACPPEDCGGVPGYYVLLDALADASDGQHDDMIDWLQNHAKNYYPYDSNAFAPESVRFANPKTRFKRVFGAV